MSYPSTPFMLGTAARHFGCQVWQLRRLYESGILAEPPRVGAFRVVTEADLPAIEAALREAGYLPAREEATP
jgi:hypothetical protein